VSQGCLEPIRRVGTDELRVAAAREEHREHLRRKLDKSENEVHDAGAHLNASEEGTAEHRTARARVNRAHRRHSHRQAEHSFAELHGADQIRMTDQERAAHQTRRELTSLLVSPAFVSALSC
jgi:hypothetical protein